MNCDQAFDVLTRGPFPSGDMNVDDAVDRHLAACHECRQLAEALRPAVGIFHEAMAEAESLSLPGYSGELSPAGEGPLLTLATPTRVTSQVKPLDMQRRGRKQPALIWPFVAAGLLGLIVGMFGENIRSRNADDSTANFASAGSHPLEAHAVNQKGRLLLASLNVSAACRGADGESERNSNSWYQCCTRCHAAAKSATAPTVPLPTLTSSCVACHSNSYRAEVSWSFQPLQWNDKQWREPLET
ncbi:MAG: hypothetical protein HON53_19960 [Planctomycetaceae bacterium]|jgi:hypothetical protein|nr:hypothetical protein [Planctomycetaceae bacterium]MBT6153316.1 hypothetical protein [Planctomycetaceae bacterium]MBT6483235.1 hypothetical protein [Planctomycetaceae bacterium]MBT6492910.1 hypothetical protein [Planctomycetaceae bacterium]